MLAHLKSSGPINKRSWLSISNQWNGQDLNHWIKKYFQSTCSSRNYEAASEVWGCAMHNPRSCRLQDPGEVAWNSFVSYHTITSRVLGTNSLLCRPEVSLLIQWENLYLPLSNNNSMIIRTLFSCRQLLVDCICYIAYICLRYPADEWSWIPATQSSSSNLQFGALWDSFLQRIVQ